jgi:FMN phosphatase YigB (HAD superfamily)
VLSDVRAIAFDLDNTLWDVEPVLVRAETRLAEWLQRHCPRIAAGLSVADMRRAREQLAAREPHNAHDLTYLRLTALTAHAREHGYDERIAGDAFEVFIAARNEVELFADVRPALARHQLFAVSLNARQIGAAKPERRCFECLAQQLALRGEEILYVGDDPLLDVAAAREAGLRSAWMNRGACAWPAELAPAELVVRDCAELAASLGA